MFFRVPLETALSLDLSGGKSLSGGEVLSMYSLHYRQGLLEHGQKELLIAYADCPLNSKE